MEKKNMNGSLERKEEFLHSVAKRSDGEKLGNEQIQKLVSLMNRSDISEIEIKHASSGLHLALRKLNLQPGWNQQQESTLAATIATGMETDSEVCEFGEGGATSASRVDEQVDAYQLTASLVGIFHPWLKPNGKTLVAAEDVVRQGQIVGTIEALTLLHEIEAAVSGRVKEICVQDGQPVEYGQVLLVIGGSVTPRT